MGTALQLSSVVLIILGVAREVRTSPHLRRTLRATIMYPGTYWCGPGNYSENGNDLGWLEDTDMCCREHDLCPEYIDAGETKYGSLTNNDQQLRFHCDCDNQFYHCLKNNVDKSKYAKSSAIILHIYFVLTNVKCFKKEHPVIRCKTYDDNYKYKCVEYLVNKTRSAVYQWFDTPTTMIPFT